MAKDAATARELLPEALEATEEGRAAGRQARSEGERVVRALAALAEGQARRSGRAARAGVVRSSHHRQRQHLEHREDAGRRLGRGRERTDVPELARRPRRLERDDGYVHAMLARVQSQMGKKDEARKNYQKFFELFKDADPDLPLLVQARDEFAKLGS